MEVVLLFVAAELACGFYVLGAGRCLGELGLKIERNGIAFDGVELFENGIGDGASELLGFGARGLRRMGKRFFGCGRCLLRGLLWLREEVGSE